ncbi:MAG: 16S rRNA (adenine(1518)-N(6)/adenine(1519)-N(6))-dimethyltransferase RsmA [bacterium]|nr:16S rRNA (adenine(1518)-N(6)/adenine(1519)-N(6))-dimethyltransferase RsmA [bacterium]
MISTVYKKKSLGQHFLHSKTYLNAVADAADIQKSLPAGRQGEVVLEIGPGEGALTEVLLERGATVVAIEKDHRLIAPLRERFSGQATTKKFVLIEGDALTLGGRGLLDKSLAQGSLPLVRRTEDPRGLLGSKSRPYKVVGNIPYYITGALIRKYLTEKHQPTTLVFLVQKEVAERITGHPSTKLRVTKESILSLSVKAYGTPVYVKTVPRGAFVPAPGVDSAILLVKNISRDNFIARSTSFDLAQDKSLRATSEVEAKFFILVKAGFAQKRKMLKRNIEGVLGKHTLALMQKAGIAENARAEDVALEQWLVLACPERFTLSPIEGSRRK